MRLKRPHRVRGDSPRRPPTAPSHHVQRDLEVEGRAGDVRQTDQHGPGDVGGVHAQAPAADAADMADRALGIMGSL